ncbi:phosphatase PAP2 family protein [Amnibacterium endophyticum]|uniref:Phosphatase PAP2 family protein n=1 Tax=Amnibacterium endophyticum TaxID=2109337 RepID=A0ABW4LJT3_9MICO
MVEVRTFALAERRRTRALAAVLVAVGLAVFLVLLVSVLTHSGVQRLDRPVEAGFDGRRDADRSTVMTVLALVFGPVGMPVIVLVAVVVWVVLARRLWRPLLLLAEMVVGVGLAQILAPLVRHPRPPVGQMLLGPDHTFSFPSGHVLGMSHFFFLTAYLLASRIRRTWVTVLATAVAVAAVGAQVVSRLYLGCHWLTDVSASVALSAVIVGAVIVIDMRRTVRVDGEPIRDRRHSALQADGT